MKSRNMIVVTLFIGALASGCSSTPTMKSIAEDSAEAARIRAKAEKEMRAEEQKQMQDNLSQVPTWALEPPKPDATGIFAVGMGESDAVRTAMHKAMLDAEFGLAKNFGQELSGSERSFTQDNNSRTAGSQYTELIDKLVSQVPVTGFEVVHQQVKAINGKYSAYVLLKLPYEQFNLVLKDQKASRSNTSVIEKQFDALEKRLEKRRKQRAEEGKALENLSQSVAEAPKAPQKEARKDGGTSSITSATVSAASLAAPDNP